MSDSDGVLDMDAIEQDALNNNFGIAEYIDECLSCTPAAVISGTNDTDDVQIIMPESAAACNEQRAQDSPDSIIAFADSLRDTVAEIASFFTEPDLVEFTDRPGTSREGINETHSAPVASTSGLRSTQRRNETYSVAPVASTSGLRSNQRRNETQSAPNFASMSRAYSNLLQMNVSAMDSSSVSMKANASDSLENQLPVSRDFGDTRVDLPEVIIVFINNAGEFIRDMIHMNESLAMPIYFERIENGGTITARIDRILYDDVLQVVVASGFDAFSPLEGHRYLDESGAVHVIIHLDYNTLYDIGFSVSRIMKIGDKWKPVKITYSKYVRLMSEILYLYTE